MAFTVGLNYVTSLNIINDHNHMVYGPHKRVPIATIATADALRRLYRAQIYNVDSQA